MIIQTEQYEPVECDAPLPCPFCGSQPMLAQLAHITTWTGPRRARREVKVAIVSSTRRMKADTFWFKCEECDCRSGGHHDSAQKAAEAWNRRLPPKAQEPQS